MCQYDDPYLLVLKDMVQHGDAKEVTVGDDAGSVLCADCGWDARFDIFGGPQLTVFHSSRCCKDVPDLRQHYW